MTIKSKMAAMVVGVLLSLSGKVALAGVDLPEADCGLGPANTCLEFGDFIVYSLPLLQEYQTDDTTPLHDSLQGLDLKFGVNEPELWVVNNNGSGEQDQGAGTGIDDPYISMQGDTNPVTPPNQDPNVEENLLFLMTSASFGGQFEVPSDPVGGPGTDDNIRQSSTTVNNTETYIYHDTSVNDQGDYLDKDGSEADTGAVPECYTDLDGCLPLWDADISELRTLLDGDDLVFFFSNNENNAGDGGLEGQDLVAWAQICLTDTNGALPEVCFVLDGTGPDILPEQVEAQQAGLTDVLPTANDLWVHVHSDLCILPGGQVLLGACDVQPVPPPAGSTTLNQSLGQNEATFAIVNLILSDLVNDPDSGYEVLTVDARLGWLNNGGDWIAIGASNVERPDIPVPLPGTLLLLGAGLVGMGAIRRKKK